MLTLSHRRPKCAWPLRSCLAALPLLGLCPPQLQANTTFDSGTTTISSGTDFGTNLYVGHSGTATMHLIAGGSASGAYGYLGYAAGGDGTAMVADGVWTTAEGLVVGYFGTGALAIQGGRVTSPGGSIGRAHGSSGVVTVTGGTWANDGNLTVGDSGAGMLTIAGGVVTVGGTLSRGSFGTITLGPGGTLQIGVAGLTGDLATSLTNDGDVVFNRSGTSAYLGTLSGSGAVTKRGDGALTFSGSNTYTGITRVDQGTLRITNPNALQATPIVVRTGGTLALPNDWRLTLSTTSVTVDQNTGGTVDVGASRITIGPGGTTAEALRADLIAGRGAGTFSGTSGIITTGGVAGMATNPVVGYRVSTSGSAIVAWAAFGDSNLDGQVSQADINLIVTGGKFGLGAATNSTWVQGDYNYSAGVTQADVNLLVGAALFGQGNYLPPATAGAGETATSPLPEPSTTAMALAGLAYGGFTLWRRRKPW